MLNTHQTILKLSGSVVNITDCSFKNLTLQNSIVDIFSTTSKISDSKFENIIISNSNFFKVVN
jgi:hypothetical protein